MNGSIGMWVGRVASALVVLFLVWDGVTGLANPASLSAEMAATGYQMSQIAPISVLALACAVIYAIPRTAVAGAILITGFLGGAICTHFRVGELGSPPQIICVMVGLLAWGGLWLRDARVRALLPLSS